MTANAKPGYAPNAAQFYRDWSIEEAANQVFAESDTDLAVYHVLPIYSFKDGLCSLDKAIEAQQRWPDRILTYCGVDPLAGPAALDELERQAELLRPVGLKLYPNSWLGQEIRGWKMDDPEVAFPLFERAQSLGIKVVAVHKALPLGPVPMEHYRVDDIDRACMAFPSSTSKSSTEAWRSSKRRPGRSPVSQRLRQSRNHMRAGGDPRRERSSMRWRR